MISAELATVIQKPFYVATETDLAFLLALEEESFDLDRQASRKAILASIRSDAQLVIIRGDENGLPCGAITLMLYKKTLRVMSIAVRQRYRFMGYGKALLQMAEQVAEDANFERVTLEADVDDTGLIGWYENLGYEEYEFLDDYYGPDRHGLRLEKVLHHNSDILVVTDYETDFFDEVTNIRTVNSDRYLKTDPSKFKDGIKIINICKKYDMLSAGYQVSLCAYERGHSAYPSIDLLETINHHRILVGIGEDMQACLHSLKKDKVLEEVVIDSLFGQSCDGALQEVNHWLNKSFEAPLIRYRIIKDKDWYVRNIEIITLKEGFSLVGDDLYRHAKSYFRAMKRSRELSYY